MLKYRHAKDVLPQGLITEIQKHTNCCYLWIPSNIREEREARDHYIIRLHFEQNRPVADICRQTYLKPRRVRQIIQAAKKARGDPSAGGADTGNSNPRRSSSNNTGND